MISIRDKNGLLSIKLEGQAETKMLISIASGFIPTKPFDSILDKVTKAYKVTNNYKIEITPGVFLMLWDDTNIYIETN